MRTHRRPLILLGVCLVFLLAGCSYRQADGRPDLALEPDLPFTWEGELEPDEFETWKILIRHQ